MSGRARAALANLALVVVSLLLAGGAAELALRLTGFASERQVATRRIYDARWTTLLDCYPSNPRGYFDIDLRRPENDALYRPLAPHRFDALQQHHPWAVLSRYNALRFRDAPVGPRPAGTKRVLVFGDSFTEGQGVRQEDTAAPVLQRLLEARAPGRFDVRNAGRRGLDFPELFEAFEQAQAYEPDLVVYALVLNDAVQPPEFRARQRFVNDWILDREHPPDEAEPVFPLLRPRLFDFVAGRVAAWRVGRETTRWYLDMWSDANPGWARTQEYLAEMDARLRRKGARLLVAPWPLFVSLESGYPFESVHETLRRFCLGRGIAYHDQLPTFRGRRTSELWVHPVDRHPNEIAQRLAAESLLPEVLHLADGR